MAKSNRAYVCQACGAVSARWAGRCESCGEWNTLVEEGTGSGVGARPGRPAPKGRKIALTGLKGDTAEPDRVQSGISEFDRVTGGGLVPGSVLLVGGDPGIGKSTLLLQALAALAEAGQRPVYVSGEESIAQVRLRAQRLGVADAPVALAAETNLADILATLAGDKPPAVLVIDSIQTVWTPEIEAAPGTVSQLRAAAQTLVRLAKATGTVVILIGHVTKEGQIAGPRVIEHMVDTVLYFEGERGQAFRILRAVKNRFGPTDEIGVFEMSDQGLRGVDNPSGLFLAERDQNTPGAAVFAGIEGTRPLLVEIQALVAPSTLGTPRRAVIGWDQNRLAMIIAVLQTHCGLSLGAHDVYLTVTGGLRVREPAADLAVAAALISSVANAPLGADTAFFGEISLSGAVRPVSQGEARIKEVAKLGFARAVIPKGSSAQTGKAGAETAIVAVDSVAQLTANIAAASSAGPQPRALGDVG